MMRIRDPNKTGKSPTGVGVHNRRFVIGSKEPDRIGRTDDNETIGWMSAASPAADICQEAARATRRNFFPTQLVREHMLTVLSLHRLWERESNSWFDNEYEYVFASTETSD